MTGRLADVIDVYRWCTRRTPGSPGESTRRNDRRYREDHRRGTLAWDRTFALFGRGGDPINGKRTPRVHELDAAFDPGSESLTVTADGETRTFDLDADREIAEAWFSAYFGIETTIERAGETGFVDRRSAGPSVVSTATIETVASWFENLTADSVRGRLRADVEIGGVEAFCEDRSVGDGAPTFAAGGVGFEGVTPCGRCVVPARDPDTGAEIEGFRERFLERREATFPDREAFDHFFRLMLIARVSGEDRGETVGVGEGMTVKTQGPRDGRKRFFASPPERPNARG